MVETKYLIIGGIGVAGAMTLAYFLLRGRIIIQYIQPADERAVKTLENYLKKKILVMAGVQKLSTEKRIINLDAIPTDVKTLIVVGGQVANQTYAQGVRKGIFTEITREGQWVVDTAKIGKATVIGIAGWSDVDTMNAVLEYTRGRA